jgi:hypothetical protein
MRTGGQSYGQKTYSAEEWIAELDGIIHRYRGDEPRGAAPLTRKQAIDRLVELGQGAAVRYLERNQLLRETPKEGERLN